MVSGGTGAGRRMAGGVLAGVLGALVATAALAGPAAPAAKAVEATGSVKQAAAVVDEPAAEASNCSKARRRLWVEGEGWIVRRITTCN
jgi:hypothetical protein